MDAEKIPPIVNKKWLYLLAGSMWFIVGIFLLSLALGWFEVLSSERKFQHILLGIGLSIPFIIMFLVVAGRNINRVKAMPESVSIFNFQPWYSYVIVVVMMSIGIMLRHSPLFKTDLGILYTSIGVAISLASLKFLRMIFVNSL